MYWSIFQELYVSDYLVNMHRRKEDIYYRR